jgi:hypothetical protein
MIPRFKIASITWIGICSALCQTTLTNTLIRWASLLASASEMSYSQQLLKHSQTRNRRLMAAFVRNWKSESLLLTRARWLETWPNTNSVAISSARQSNKLSVSIETKNSRNSTAQTRGMWHGLQSITDYKKKSSPVANQDVLLPDKLKNFFARFEDNTVPLTWPATKTCGLSFTAADVSKTFKRVNPRKAAGPDLHPQPRPQSMRRPASWCVYGHIQSILIPVCCSHILQEGHHCSCSQES